MTEPIEDYTKLDELTPYKSKHSRARAKSSWFVYGHKNGRPYIVKASDEEDANRINFEKYDGSATVEELDTINIATATQMVKAKWLHQNRTLEEATQRANHGGKQT